MREKSSFFLKVRVAGSYWDKLKVGLPVEFDKNFILRRPSKFRNFIKVSLEAPRFYQSFHILAHTVSLATLNLQIIPAPNSPSFVFVDVGQGLKELKKDKYQWEMFKCVSIMKSNFF